MLSPLLDHLTAIVVGTVILMTLFVLQTRQRLTSVDETIHLSVREYTQNALGTVSGDLGNAIGERRARTDTLVGGFRTLSMTDPVKNAAFLGGFRTHAAPKAGDYLFGADTLANGMTGWLAFPSRVTVGGGRLRSAQIVYRLQADTMAGGAPRTAFVNGQDRQLYYLERWTSFAPDGTDPASGFERVSGGIVTDFRAELVGFSTEPVRKGAAPDGVHSIRLTMSGAVDRLDQISTDQINTREANGVRLSTTVRPSDL